MAPDNKDEFKDEGPTLSKSFSKYFTSGEFSDMKIKCGETVHAVHRTIVCGQSYFFANAMKEKHNTIDIDHDHPTTIKAVLEYLYLGKYDDLGFGDKSDERVTLHIDVHATADKYGIGGLRKYSTGQIEDILDAENRDVVNKSLAQLVGTTWEKTPENDKLLRPLMMKRVSRGIGALIRETGFLAITEDIEGFSSALVKSVVAANEDPRTRFGVTQYTFPYCGETVDLKLVGDNCGWASNRVTETYCPVCGTVHSNEDWKSNKVSPDWDHFGLGQISGGGFGGLK